MYPMLIDYCFVKLKPTDSLISFALNNRRVSLKINKSAKEILRLCNGYYSIEEMIRFFHNKYGQDDQTIEIYINKIVSPFISAHIIENHHNMENTTVVRGSSQYYTPDSIIWEITDNCPLNCKHCYLGDKNGLSVCRKDIDKIIRLIMKCGVTTVQLTGGEPLTHPDIQYIINELVNEKLTVNITTSGTVYDDKILDMLSKLISVNGLIQVSIDGLEKYNNFVRGSEYAYQKSIDFIKELKKRGIQCTVATSLINQSEDEIECLTEKLKCLGVSMVTVQLISLQGNAKTNDLVLNYTHSRVKKLITRLNNKFKSDNFCIREYEDVKEKNCGAGYNVILIKPNLDVTPCPMLNISLGNLNDASIEEIMQIYGEQFHNSISPSEKTCGKCNLKEICGDCIGCAFENKSNVKLCKWYESKENKFLRNSTLYRKS